MANNTKRKIVEEGIVLSKEFKSATSEFINSDGRKVEAAPDRFIVTVASSCNCTDKLGLENVTVLNHKVDRTLFEKLNYLTKVKVSYNFTSYRLEPLSIELLSKQN